MEYTPLPSPRVAEGDSNASAVMHWKSVRGEHWAMARSMRKEPTKAERVLWNGLRKSSLEATFRRQHPIGPYIVDFICVEANLVIELDGDVHAGPQQMAHDRSRQLYLESRGYRVIRFLNSDVFGNMESVLQTIATHLVLPPPSQRGVQP
jgi:5-methyltetrahydrofolate--homocysteine methyltransferase